MPPQIALFGDCFSKCNPKGFTLDFDKETDFMQTKRPTKPAKRPDLRISINHQGNVRTLAQLWVSCRAGPWDWLDYEGQPQLGNWTGEQVNIKVQQDLIIRFESNW